MDYDNLLNLDDLKDVFEELNQMDDIEIEQDEEEIASQRRYEEIIKKRKEEEQTEDN